MLNFLVPLAYAKDTVVDIQTPATAGDFFGFTCIAGLIRNLASAGLMVAGMLSLVFFVWGGIDYMLAGGDKTKVDSAQKKISGALIGLAIVASSWALFVIVRNFFGINLDNICSDNPTGINTSAPVIRSGPPNGGLQPL